MKPIKYIDNYEKKNGKNTYFENKDDKEWFAELLQEYAELYSNKLIIIIFIIALCLLTIYHTISL